MAVTLVPTVEDIPTGVILDDLDLNRIARAVEFVTDLPRWTIHQWTGTTSMTSGVWTSIGMDFQEEISDHVTHSTSTNNSRVTIQVPGVYELSGKVSWQTNTSDRRQTRWAVNGSALTGSEFSLPPATTFPMLPLAHIRTRLSRGDYVEVQAGHGAGVTLTTLAGVDTTVGSYFSGRWVGR